MLRRALMLVVALAFVTLAELAGGHSGETAAVTGTVTYLQRIALAADAIVDVQLRDVSLQDGPAKVLAEVRIPAAGKQVPIPFRLPYAPTDINPAHSYAIGAAILVDVKTIFTSTSSHPVSTRGAPTELSIVVQPVEATGQTEGSSRGAAPAIEETYWKLIELGGTPVAADVGATEANLVLHADGKTLAGLSGCNRLVGGYQLRRRSLHFTPAGLTRMACPEPLMKQEQALVEALIATTSYRIVGLTLELRNGTRVLARFESSSVSGPSANPTTAPTAPDSPTNGWLGQWNGPEGTYLVLSKNGGKYVVKIRSLDGLETYEGVPVGDGVQFTRHGQAESIHAGDGKETGMKWLLDRKNCLIIKSGEGFCRD